MKNLTFQLILIASMSGLLFSGCAPVYVSNRLNTPLFDDGSQANMGIGYGIDGVSLNGAFSPFKSMAIIGNYSRANRQNEYNDKFEHSIKELGGGYFYHLPLKNEKEQFFFEGFVGYGTGKSNALVNEDGGIFFEKSESKYGQFFVQPSIGYRNKQLGLAGTLRLNFINFNHLEIEKDNSNIKTYDNLKATSFVLAGTIYGWLDPVRIGLQAGVSLLGQSKDESLVLDNYPLVLNLSVEYTLRGNKKAE